MKPSSPSRLDAVLAATRAAPLSRKRGKVRSIVGLSIQCEGLDVAIGERVTIFPKGDTPPMDAEVVSVAAQAFTVMAFGAMQGLAAGCEVEVSNESAGAAVGKNLLGRVIDGLGNPIDGGPTLTGLERAPLEGRPTNPMSRPRISAVLETGVRSIDTFLTLGRGQRAGIFSGSGVGKTTLLGMIARHVVADVNIIALIGERGREVREFIDKQLGAQALARSVLVVATADQPALVRVRAAKLALSIAEYFRAQGEHVMLTMDSITRYAMARREIGLAAGEPPTARGYTPSVFADLPRLAERCGTHESGGSITALMTVLVDADDMNEPVSDCLRATLDAHIVLSRELAQEGQFPAVDVLRSASRVMHDVAEPDTVEAARALIRGLALLERNRQVVDLGAYAAGSNPELDTWLALREPLRQFLMQRDGGAPRTVSVGELLALAGRMT